MNYSLKKAKKSLKDTFKSLSYDIMHQNNEAFFHLATANFDKYQNRFEANVEIKHKELEKVLLPVKESIEKINQYSKEIEKQRHAEFLSLNKQIEMLIESENVLRKETSHLASALKSPGIKGAWGQIHLKRVVELAGLLNNCDFYEQKSVFSDGKLYRPDVVIKLPGEKQVIIDAKTPIDAFLEYQENDHDKKYQKLKTHAQNLKKHILDLSSKEYFSKFEITPEYVILFLPAEAILSSAIKIDPTLLEVAARKNVIIATPTTLIAILKTIAHLWKEDNISKNAFEIALAGRELYERLLIMNGYFAKLGKNLSISVDAYNQTLSSFNSRVMVSARKLKDMGLSYKDNPAKEVSKTCNVFSDNN